MKNRLHKYDINKCRSRHGHKYTNKKNCDSKMMVICITTFETQFLKKVSNTESQLKKRVAYKKSMYYFQSQSFIGVL